MKRLREHLFRHRDGYGPLVVASLFVGVIFLSGLNPNIAAEPLCRTVVHLLTVLPDGRINVPGKSGQWKNIEDYMKREVKGAIRKVDTDYGSRLLLVERRCGG